MWIEVARDIENVRRAARELLEESFEQSHDERTARLSADVGRELELTGRRTLSPGYYDRAAYLFGLDELMSVVQFAASEITLAEVQGVTAVRQARVEFERQHPGCPKCGALNNAAASRCRKCMAEMGR